jgi:hypothetical protein
MEMRDVLPRLFISSSPKGLEVAEYLQQALEGHCEATLPEQGVFVLGQSPLESLASACKHSDFAAFVLTPDDMFTKRGYRKRAPRENVLFEIGFFMGGLGRHRTFIVYCHEDESALPSHLRGVTLATFRKRVDENMEATISPVAIKIREAIEKIRTSDSAQTSTRNMLRDFVKHNNVVNELKQAHHMLQKLAIPLYSLVAGFRAYSTWQDKPPGPDALEAIRAGWGAVQQRFYVIEDIAPTMKSPEANSLFNPLIQLKNDFEAILNESKPVRLRDLSDQLYQRCQAKLEIIDDRMLEQFKQTDSVTEQISRSISDDPTQS